MKNLLKIVESQFELVLEAPADNIIDDLKRVTQADAIRKSGNTVHLLVPISQRQETIKYLLKQFPDAKYNTAMPGSSLGGIEYQNGKIIVKPAGKQGTGSAGVANEMELLNILQEMANEYPSFTVMFKASSGQTWTVNNVFGVEHSGKETTGRLKGDLRLLVKDKKLPISIKKISADVWESADSYFGPTAFPLLKKLQQQKKVTITKLGKKNENGVDYVKISPEVAVEPTEEEINNVVFGEDIKAQQGRVVIQTFAPQHFVRSNDKIIIECEAIIKDISDIPRSHLMVWLIRNDSTRNPAGGVPGLRITAAVQTRAFGVHGTKDTLYVNKNGRELENPMADVAAEYLAAKEKKQREREEKKKVKEPEIKTHAVKGLRARRTEPKDATKTRARR